MSWQDILKMKKPKYPFGRPPTPKEKALQLILETVEQLPYARREGNKIIAEPDWAKEDKKFYHFDLEDIHKPEMCVYANNNKICLGQGSNPNNAVPADFYVTFLMLAGNENDFNKLWRRERVNQERVLGEVWYRPARDYGEEDGEA